METKKCTQCGIEKPITQFGKEKYGKYGVKSKCKVCKAETRKEQYEKNKDNEIAYGKQYRINNQEKEKARAKRYRELHPEKIKESQNKYRETNLEKIKQQRKKWATSNKELINKYSKCHRDTRREFLDIIKLEEGCQICGYNDHPRALQFDHIDPKEKSFTISQLLTCAMDKLLIELEKCRVLCANCHSIHSWQEQHWKSKENLSTDAEEVKVTTSLTSTITTFMDKSDPRVEITITGV